LESNRGSATTETNKASIAREDLKLAKSDVFGCSPKIDKLSRDQHLNL